MKYDIFFSICQTEVDGYLPSEETMWTHFFDQLQAADNLGFGTAWLAETHLSCQTQKKNPMAVIPHFKGEIGLNTDIFQLAHLIFERTKNLNVGSAIRNILCNGGPVAHAEATKTFLTLHSLRPNEKRLFELGFAAGRFPFSYRAYGIKPRDSIEEAGWDVVKNKVFQEATLILLRLLNGDEISSQNIQPLYLKESDFRNLKQWEHIRTLAKTFPGRLEGDQIRHQPFFEFETLRIIPSESPMDLLKLTIGSHDPETQIMANQILPTGVFNLSITPQNIIEQTHERMKQFYHRAGGLWQRSNMPRTALVFVDSTKGLSPEQQSQRAKERAQRAWKNYWVAMENTLDPYKIAQAVENSIAGNPDEVAQIMATKYHPEDRLMLWFDFNNHNNEQIIDSMKVFMEEVKPKIEDYHQ